MMLLNMKAFYGLSKPSLSFTRLWHRYDYSKQLIGSCHMHLNHKDMPKKLIVDPQRCLHDESVHIKAVGLDPGAEVTFTSTAKDSQQNYFFSYAHYKADSSGIIDLKLHEAIGGTYKGLFSMGLIACLLPSPKESKRKRFFVNNFDFPLPVQINVLQGHIGKLEAFEPDPQLILDTTIHERVYLSSGCKRIPVKFGRIRGALFLPAGDGPFPGVIDLFGVHGGLIQFRAAQLASRGIASLALAYFRHEDLPEQLEFVDMSYFEEAVHFLLSHEKIKKPSVIAIGSSKGSDIACSMGIFIPEVKAVVSINGIPASVLCPLKVQDRVIPPLIGDLSNIKIVEDGLYTMIDTMYDSKYHPESRLPLHEADAQFLFVVAKDDENMNVKGEVAAAVERLKAKGKSNFEVLFYEGAGHLLEPPYSPFCGGYFNHLVKQTVLSGGNPKDHTTAQVDAWDHIIKFIKNGLY